MKNINLAKPSKPFSANRLKSKEIVKKGSRQRRDPFLFGKLHVCTYICVVKLEEAIKSVNFKSETHKAVLNTLYTAWWLKTTMSKELKQFGLTHEQYNVLRILKGKSPEEMCVKDIACRMIEKSSNVPRIIDRLVLKKLVKRSNDVNDKRHTVMSLTAAGLNILDLSTQRINAMFENVVDINEQSAKELNQLLELMREQE